MAPNPTNAPSRPSEKINLWLAIVASILTIISIIISQPFLFIIFAIATIITIWLWLFPRFIQPNNTRIVSIVVLGLLIASFLLGSGLEYGNSALSSWFGNADCSKRSGESQNARSPMYFVNETDRVLEAYWIQPDGQEKYYADIAPNGIDLEYSFLNHSWCIRDKQTKAAVFSAIGNGNKQVFLIRNWSALKLPFISVGVGSQAPDPE